MLGLCDVEKFDMSISQEWRVQSDRLWSERDVKVEALSDTSESGRAGRWRYAVEERGRKREGTHCKLSRKYYKSYRTYLAGPREGEVSRLPCRTPPTSEMRVRENEGGWRECEEENVKGRE